MIFSPPQLFHVQLHIRRGGGGGSGGGGGRPVVYGHSNTSLLALGISGMERRCVGKGAGGAGGVGSDASAGFLSYITCASRRSRTLCLLQSQTLYNSTLQAHVATCSHQQMRVGGGDGM